MILAFKYAMFGSRHYSLAETDCALPVMPLCYWPLTPTQTQKQQSHTQAHTHVHVSH